MAKPNLMAFFISIIAKQFIDNLGTNIISKEGCKWLSKANWRHLTSASMGKN